MLGYDSGKVPGSDSGKDLAQSRVSIRVKTWVRRPCKTKCVRQGDFFALGSIQVGEGDLKESEPRSPGQEEDQRIWFKFKD
jgi:hypothetical protein